ncbi:UDP-N-acetylmuramoyl-L-alanyl-D-glutamate--2,6-diaminopimelate ligase [Aliidiomarina minuta]|uniref:UDP-N-acetylmuramoyl-L-alanyl-D-glutamate--2,6-diaminopimelate ligase n=1 Tax=Aliidiomarina minuta TaxID=880057 RepID=A0A432W999_9GAMM|nr:UDP-N-acetylmuramoyl-L-alanyl-D-glutamate--2,6-diaminopimelate ligase [Aliidiomarina minuta]RUO26625.1 UDP-N-acetylmuramoyl-L-alanyl-D-glutamate--2,6-diaminopimelate ligase [Aliidiomarina minuta]
MTNLASLLPVYTGQLPDTEISGLKLDSRQVTPGDCFIAVKGYQVDGRNFINSALEAGASAVLQQANTFKVDLRGAVPVVSVPELPEQLSAIAGRFYQHPDKQLKLVGVTGTNGKTTITNLVAQLFAQVGQKTAVMGTLGSGFINQLLAEKNTTPDACTVQQRLASLAAEGAQRVAMEVSSHALVQGRVNALSFDAVVASNVSRDHLDYHGSMDSYAASKRDLFVSYPARCRIFNADDKLVSGWYTKADNHYRFSLNSDLISEPDTLVASDMKFHAAGADFELHWQGNSHSVRSILLGDFNVSNLLAAALVVLVSGYSLQQVAEAMAEVRAVAGRMEMFRKNQGPLVIVDYAHTPDALQQVLKAARRHCKGNLWCVFGCGGDRDRGKRPQMGNVASQLADIVVVTDDNPRTEPALDIMADIVSGATGKARIIQRPGRKEAVLESMQNAGPDDVIVMAGKGHEDYQVVGTQTLNYNERAVVAAFMGDAAYD